MKLFRLALVALGCSLLLPSCASPTERRIQHNPEIYSKLSATDKQSVQTGKITEGMSKEAVFLSWGPPARVARGSSRGRPLERWTYTGARPIWRQSYGMGWGRFHGYCGVYDPYYYGGPEIEYIPFDAAHVEFVDAKVTSWSDTAGR